MIAAMKTKTRSFWIWLAVVWIWPLALLLTTFRWHMPSVGLRLLCKSTWVLFAGVVQGWIVVLLHAREDRHPDPRVVVYMVLSVASWLLLPFGLGRWEFRASGAYSLAVDWYYLDNLFLSLFMHMPTLAFLLWVFTGYGGYGGSVPDVSDKYDLPDPPLPSGSGLWGKKGWLDDVWKGGQVSDDFIGHRGEFDLNDEARRVSEDMQQFHHNHPDADLSDHYFWDDVLDAETDDYLD